MGSGSCSLPHETVSQRGSGSRSLPLPGASQPPKQEVVIRKTEQVRAGAGLGGTGGQGSVDGTLEDRRDW